MSIEKYIEQNRQGFDQIEPTPTDAMWFGIHDERMRRKSRRRIFLYSAAAVLLIPLTALATLSITGNLGERSPYNGGYANSNNNYQRVSSSGQDIIDFTKLDKSVYGELIREYEIADSMYTNLKDDLAEMPEADKAISLAIKHHERRLRILELLEREIENQKRYEANEEEIKM